MLIETPRFGKLEVAEERIVTFPEGLLGIPLGAKGDACEPTRGKGSQRGKVRERILAPAGKDSRSSGTSRLSFPVAPGQSPVRRLWHYFGGASASSVGGGLDLESGTPKVIWQ